MMTSHSYRQQHVLLFCVLIHCFIFLNVPLQFFLFVFFLYTMRVRLLFCITMKREKMGMDSFSDSFKSFDGNIIGVFLLLFEWYGAVED